MEETLVGILDFILKGLKGTTSYDNEIFNDLRPIRGPDDPRISKLHSVLQWFEEWETAAVEKKSFFCYQTVEDVKSMLVGFLNLVQNHFQSTMLPTTIIPGRVNSDLIENWFCQQRTWRKYKSNGKRLWNRCQCARHNAGPNEYKTECF